jgi:hypothetical protein
MMKSYGVKAANTPTVIAMDDRRKNAEHCLIDNLHGKPD